MSIYLNEPKKSAPIDSEKSNDNDIEITPSIKETIIQFNTNENDQVFVETERIKNKKLHMSPIIRRTPNTKTDIIIQKIYSNRRNIIRNINSKNTTHFKKINEFTHPSGSEYEVRISKNNQDNDTNLSQNSSNSKIQFKQPNLTKYLLSSSNILSYPLSTIVNSELLHNKVSIDTDKVTDDNNLSISSNYINTTDVKHTKDNIDLNINKLNNENSSPSTNISTNISSTNISSIGRSLDNTINDDHQPSITSENSEYNYNYFSYPYEKKKRKHYKNIKIKKYIKNSKDKGSGSESVSSVIINNDNIFENQKDIVTSSKNTPLISPRTISNELWNETVENYYMEFQKICKDESKKYKCLSNYNEIVSKILKFLLLVSGCFTFTLSITIPNSFIMTTTTTISSILTAIITSIIGFFQFEKLSEIQYNIYKEFDKLYGIISLELLKPTYMRSDPYELILLIQNRRDELLKTLHKK
jgi:hypothetical protein